MAAARNQQQPTYDLITGTASTSRLPTTTAASARRTSLSAPLSANKNINNNNKRPSLSGGAPVTSLSGIPVRATPDNEALRAALNAARYELDTLRTERAMQVERLGGEVREAERRAEAEAKRAEEDERVRRAAEKRLDDMRREKEEGDTRAVNERLRLEASLREREAEMRRMKEEVAEASEEIEVMRRERERELRELQGLIEMKNKEMERMAGEVRVVADKSQAMVEQLDAMKKELEQSQQDNLRLKALTGDQETLSVVKRELVEQVGHIKKLEKLNGDMNNELKRLRRERKAVEVVEEEKRNLENRLGLLDDLRRQLGESEIRRRVLEDERTSWTAYLEGQGGDTSFESPEDIARAFVHERMERLQLVERLGQFQPELAVKDEIIGQLEEEKSKLQSQVKQLRVSGGDAPINESKARARLEKQRVLAVKEVEFLRAQLRSLEDETIEFDPEKADQAKSDRARELERLVDEYRAEVASLHDQLNSAEKALPPATTNGLKRPAPDGGEEKNEAIGSLTRKLRKMQDALVSVESKNAALAADLKASTTQLKALRESSKTRVLDLKNNPTAQYHAIKTATLETLRRENDALLSQLETSAPPPDAVPTAVVEAMRLRLAEKEAELAQRDKKTLRLKTIWSAKAVEFRDAVASTLGWNVTFERNGKTRLSPTYYPTSIDPDTGDVRDNWIEFDGEEGTMKISGGEHSRFAGEIRDMADFWLDGRGEVPCFLAAANLEFWERIERAKQGS